MMMVKPNPKPGLLAPQLPKPLPTGELEALKNYAEYTAFQAAGRDLSGQVASGLLFDQVSLRRIIFQRTRLERLRLFDVRASACDMTGADWEKARLRRVEFSGCRMIAIQLLEAQFEHVRFKECNLEEAIFASAVFKGARFERCNLRGALFEQADLTGVVFRDCDLTQANLSGAKLASADLRGSLLGGMKVGAGDLRGSVIEASQAAQVVALMGVIIQEWENPPD